ncbi:MAG: AmmeMemoRadiSam system protein A [Nanoarchaeota archaeon]|nr:AmmeMemoRadiSam system protein A [Nanoarchaeota archaeon]
MEDEKLFEKYRELFLKIAKDAIQTFVRTNQKKCVDEYPEELRMKRGVFVTINENSELRGCIGVPYPEMDLIDAICESAVSATQDPRFEPLREDELDKISIEISILTKPELISAKDPRDYLNIIRPSVDGLIIEEGFSSGLFLPQVWDEIKDPEKFLDELCLKAGLPVGEWKNPQAKLYRFNAFIIKEESKK